VSAEETFDLGVLIGTLDDHRVEYMVVGGVAARAYGATRPTHDLDVLVRTTTWNYERLIGALQELGAVLYQHGQAVRPSPVPHSMEPHLDLFKRYGILRWRTSAGDMDTVVDIPVLKRGMRTYDDIGFRAERRSVDGVEMRVVAFDDMLRSKMTCTRAKDREALRELTLLAERRAT
jgi:hypothetical protein